MTRLLTTLKMVVKVSLRILLCSGATIDCTQWARGKGPSKYGSPVGFTLSYARTEAHSLVNIDLALCKFGHQVGSISSGLSTLWKMECFIDIGLASIIFVLFVLCI